MISKIRGTLHTNAYRYILWTFLIIFMISSLSIGLLFRSSHNEFMRINNYSVTKTEFSHKVNTINDRIKSFRQQFGRYADQFLYYMGLSGDPSEIAINELVREKLLLEAADGLSLKGLSGNYVIKKLENSTFALQNLGMFIPSYFYNSLGELNPDAIFKHASRHNISVSDFEGMVEDALRQFFINSLIPTAVYVSPVSLDSMYTQEYSPSRTYKVFTLKTDDRVKELKKEKISEQELKKYFNNQNEKNKRYWGPEKRSGTVWKFTAADYGVKDLSKDKFELRFMGDARRVIAQNNQSALQEFAQRHGGRQSVLRDIAIDTENTADKQFTLAEKLFAIKTSGKSGAFFSEGNGYIVTLDTIQERQFFAFEKVSESVLHDFLKEKARQEIVLEVNVLLKNNNPQALAQFAKNNLTEERIHVITDFNKKSKNWEELEKKGLPVARMQKMIHPGYSFSFELKNEDGIGVISLESIEKPKSNIDAAAIDILKSKSYSQDLSVVAAAFIDSLQKRATINR